MYSYNPYYAEYLMHYGVKGRSGRKRGSRNSNTTSKPKNIYEYATQKYKQVTSSKQYKNAVNYVTNNKEQIVDTVKKVSPNVKDSSEKLKTLVKNITAESESEKRKKQRERIIKDTARYTISYILSKFKR